jgi:hypothetical protein
VLKLVDVWVWPFAIISACVLAGQAFAHDPLEHLVGSHLWELTYNLALAIIAAFIFYLLVDVNRRWQDARSIAPYITKQIKRMKGDVEGICRDAAAAHGDPFPAEWSFDTTDVGRVFVHVAPTTVVKTMSTPIGPATMLDAIVYRVSRTDEALANLARMSSTLGARGMTHVTAIQGTSYLATVKAVLSTHRGMANKNLEIFTKLISDHYAAVLALEDWAKEASVWVD